MNEGDHKDRPYVNHICKRPAGADVLRVFWAKPSFVMQRTALLAPSAVFFADYVGVVLHVEDAHKRPLGNLHRPDHLHPLFTLFLFV